MRIRSIKPEFFKDEELAALHPLARELFVGLWCLADGEGRLEDRPIRIKAEVLPYDVCDVDAFLDDLHAGDFITRYTVASEELILVRQFRKHQRISGVEAARESEYPSPDHPEAIEKQCRSNGEAFEKRTLLRSRKQRRSSGEGAIAQEGKGREGKGIGREASSRDDEAFCLFWAAYPRKVGKGTAAKKWASMSPQDRKAAGEKAVAFGAAWAQRPREDHQYCPHPSTWLSDRRWEDDPAEWRVRTSIPRNGRPAPTLIGAHPPGPRLREIDEDSPEEIVAIVSRLRRREATDAEIATLDAWQRGTDAH